MGALASNRKRDYHSFSPNGFCSPYRADFQLPKKPKFSSVHVPPEPSLSSSSSRQVLNPGSRIQQYPKPTQGLRREVQGPCRNFKFLRSSEMGNSISGRLEQARNDAFGYFGAFKRNKEVVRDGSEERSERRRFWDGRKGKEVVVVEEAELDGDVEILENRRGWDGRKGKEVVEVDEAELDGDVEILKNGGGRNVGVRFSEQVVDDELLEKYRKFEEDSAVTDDVRNQTPTKVNDTGKRLESLKVDTGREGLELVYKKLYESAKRRGERLGELDFQIGLSTKKWSLIPRPGKKPEEDILQVPFLPLTEEDEEEISKALANYNRRKVLVTHKNSNLEITGEMMQCLRPGMWLNDEVINVYLELLKEREKREPTKFLKCHFFNTFFYQKLISGETPTGYDYKAVRRWTTKRKLGYGLIECDKIFVPIHKEIHWCLAIISIKDQKFQYLDSLKGRDNKVLKFLAKYYVDEVKDKSGKDINVSSWKHEFVTDLPAQLNGFDCGMFMIKYADFYSRGLGLIFKQENMSYFRMRTAKEILKLKAE